MGLIARFNQWKRAVKDRRIEGLTAQATDLKEGQQYDLLFLHERGVVRVKGSGQSITKIYAAVENLIRKELRVVVKPGTYFVSSGGHQNMATTTEYTFTLYPCRTEHLGISAVCINANRPIPGKKDRFSGVARVSNEVARFLEASMNEDPMVIQAGVWTLTDNYSRYDVINHLISRDSLGNTSHPVTHDHCDKAKAILEKLEIPHRLSHSDIPYEKKTKDYDNGSYEGEFRHGERYGRGRYSFKSGGYYEGEWRNNKMHGEGILVFDSGGKYVGKFEDGRAVGGWYHLPSGGRKWSVENTRGQWEHPDPTKGIANSLTNAARTEKKTYICKNCSTQYNAGELDDGRWWNVCPKCKGPITHNS